jgi:hypothetical protein
MTATQPDAEMVGLRLVTEMAAPSMAPPRQARLGCRGGIGLYSAATPPSGVALDLDNRRDRWPVANPPVPPVPSRLAGNGSKQAWLYWQLSLACALARGRYGPDP